MATLTKLSYSVSINAPRERVWKVLWTDETYRKWTSVFSAGSHAVSDWKKGSRVQFLTEEKDGMYSVIHDLVPNELMVFKHLGMIEKGVEQPSSEQTKAWEGSLESYRLEAEGGATRLTVEVDTVESFITFMNEAFPKALEAVKQLAEGE